MGQDYMYMISNKEEDSDQFQPEIEAQLPKTEIKEELIRISSNDSSPNIDDVTHQSSSSNPLHTFLQSAQDDHVNEAGREEVDTNMTERGSNIDEQIAPPKVNTEDNNIIQQIQRESIIRQAQLQRIGGTYDYFAHHIQKYKRHLLSRKIVLTNITSMIDKNKIIKANTVILLKEYFRNYISLCNEFHQKSNKYETQQREQNDNKVINISIELKPGFGQLLALRKKTGSDVNRLQKYMKGIVGKIDKVAEGYWSQIASHQLKPTAKRDTFLQKEKKFMKRIEKIGRVYSRGRNGEQISQDVFQQMGKFIRDERQLRFSIFDWGQQIMNLRNHIIQGDVCFFNDLESLLTQFKSFNSTIYQLQSKKFNFLQSLKQDIENKYLFEKLCTPLDNDYILSILNFKKTSITLLQQSDYQKFLNEEYFGQVIGQTSQFLKGTISKIFALKNEDEELVKTITGNLICYNQKTLEIKYKMKAKNTFAEFQGNGCVILKEKIIGIIFDSDHFQNVYFRDDNRAEELIIFQSGELINDQE